jgi:hypothetical protein
MTGLGIAYFTFKAEHEALREHLIRLEFLSSSECDLHWKQLQLACANTVKCTRSAKTSTKREGF